MKDVNSRFGRCLKEAINNSKVDISNNKYKVKLNEILDLSKKRDLVSLIYSNYNL